MLYWVDPQRFNDSECLAGTPLEIEAILRALDFYLHSDLIDAFPFDELPLATLLERLKQLSGEVS